MIDQVNFSFEAIQNFTFRQGSEHQPIEAKARQIRVFPNSNNPAITYYIYGFLFVIFDVESVFLFPWARVFQASATRRWSRWASSSGSSRVGLLYAWRKGVLRWA